MWIPAGRARCAAASSHRWLALRGAWLLAFAPGAIVHADKAPAPKPAHVAPALLPASVGDLHLSAPAVTQAGPAAASIDPAHAAMLREDGLLDTAQGTYAAGAGPAFTVRAYRFGDATGTFAAFTAYRQPDVRREDVGREGASQGKEVLFWTGATLVDATLAQPDPGTLAELRALAAAIPKPYGPEGTPPPLPGYLPKTGLVRESVHYAIGPAGYATTGGVLPESVLEFSHDAEVAVAQYSVHGGNGTGKLILLEYPTPQIAGDRQRAIEALLKNGGASPLTMGDPGVITERVGPLLALTSGGFSAAEAHTLLSGVHYDATVTIDHPEGYVSEIAKTAKMLLGIAYLTGILAVSAVLLAIFLGSGRVLIRKIRGQPISSMNDDDFISLKIS
jgi:hypothetical protein